MVRIGGGGIPRRNRPPSTVKLCSIYSLLLITFLASILILSLSYYVYTGGVIETSPQQHALYQQQAPRQQQQQPSPKATTIAYAISITSCEAIGILDGAAVLQHSIHLSSIQNPQSGSKYDYTMYAFVHPQATSCSDSFTKLGYNVLIRDTPINVTDIRGPYLKEKLPNSGCCGEKEFIKLYAYTLFDYPVVVHLDLDVLILKPLDDLFDAMVDGPSSSVRRRLPVMHDETIPEKIDAFFTRDYNSINPGHEHVGVQGGFLVVRPSQEAFDEYVEVILEGNFGSGGWGGQTGMYWGVMQIQGLCSYYYDILHPKTSVELNRCIYNLMGDDPRDEPKNGETQGKCRDGKNDCQDCQNPDSLSTAKSIHFTVCRKPWTCHSSTKVKRRELCKRMHHEWFRVRKDFELSQKMAKSGNGGKKDVQAYCRGDGKEFYNPIEL